ncbi:MAG: Wzz/FepE/Etk N-terminal domain-containing protein [Candidatus Scalinduaceae bacterium]
MKEYSIELIDCFRVIWKRKILIIVGTLVCLVAGGIVNLRLPEIYRAEALISIGKTVNSRSVSLSPSFALVDTPKYLAESIPAEYGLNTEEALKYPLKVEVVRDPSMIKVIQEGPDRRRVGELLKGVVNRLIGNHLRKTESSIQPYRIHIENLEADIKAFQKSVAQMEAQLEEWRSEKMNIEKTDPAAVVSLQNTLWDRETDLKNIQKGLLSYRSFVDNLKEYKTKVVGGVKAGKTPVKPKKKLNVIIGGVVGLTMSLFLALFIEYLGKVREREREKEEKKKDDSVLA